VPSLGDQEMREALISLVLLTALGLHEAAAEAQNELDVVFVVDISNGNRDAFISQLLRARETVRFISQLPNCTARYGLVAFHRTAVNIIGLESDVASNVDKYSEVLLTLRPRQNARANLTVGLKTALSAFANSSSLDDERRKVVFLLHDGENEDNIDEVLEILNEARHSTITVMVIASSQSTHNNSLLGLVDGEKARLYKKGADRLPFDKTIRKIASAGIRRFTSIRRRRPSLISSRVFASNTLSLEKTGNCSREIDVIIVLDTSGSIYHYFEEQRSLAEDLTRRLGDPRGLRIGLVRFSARPSVAVPLDAPLSKEEVLERVHLTSFTGGATRISLAMEAAMDELRRAGRHGVQQYLVLLSDGHGQETWREASRVGERVAASHIVAYAASTSTDHNIDELALYVPERERIYTRARLPSFVADVVGPIVACLQKPNGVTEVEKTSTTISRTFPTAPLAPQGVTPTAPKEILVVATPKTKEKDDVDEDDFSIDGSGETATTTMASPTPSVVPSDLVAVSAIDDFQQALQSEREKTVARSTTVSPRQIIPSTFILPENKTTPGAVSGHTPLTHASAGCDVILVIDRSQSVESDFLREKEASLNVVDSTKETAGRSAVGSVRFGVISFAANATVDRPLSIGAGPEVSETIRGIAHTGGSTSVVQAMRAALTEALKRRVDSSLLILLISDGHSKDHWTEITKIAGRIHAEQKVQVIALTASDHYSKEELMAWAKLDSNIFTAHSQSAWLNRVKQELLTCSAGSLEVDQILREASTATSRSHNEVDNRLPTTFRPQPRPSTLLSLFEQADRQLHNTATQPLSPTTVIPFRTDHGKASTVSHEFVHVAIAALEDAPHVTTIASPAATAAPAAPAAVAAHGTPLAAGDCVVDVIFVMDVSQSVEDAFKRQREFATQLIDKLPEEIFTSGKARVGIVAFNFAATVEASLGKHATKSAILSALKAVPERGGSTSVARGMNLAIDQFIAARRPTSRSLAVLMSDGQSQDHWDAVVAASKRLRAENVTTFAVTASKEYAFRELEMYAGEKWHVYIDARIHVFLKDAADAIQSTCSTTLRPLDHLTTEEVAVVRTTSKPVLATTPRPKLPNRECEEDKIDVLLMIDSSSGREETLERLRKFAGAFVERLSEQEFENRIYVGLIRFTTHTQILSPLGSIPTRSDILYDIARVEADDKKKRPSFVAAIDAAIREFRTHGRRETRRVLIFASEGPTNDTFGDIKHRADALRRANITVWAGADAMSKVFFGEEALLELAGSNGRLHENADEFGEAIARSLACNGHILEPLLATTTTALPSRPRTKEIDVIEKRDFVSSKNEAIFGSIDSKIVAVPKNCRKMDLMIILDASTSREDVFEHQRELALSLVERLPISKEDDSVHLGLRSFTSTSELRQQLGPASSKAGIRKVIESVRYVGGSTRTAQAVELSLQDVARGKRDDAVQVIVLMNDGRSQDTWDEVLRTSKHFSESKTERFVVALGSELDPRELLLYAPRERLYRDSETERLLKDVVALLGDEGCFASPVIPTHKESLVEWILAQAGREAFSVTPRPERSSSTLSATISVEGPADEVIATTSTVPLAQRVNVTVAPLVPRSTKSIAHFSTDCDVPYLDFVFILDRSGNGSLPSVSNNRFLLLDVLGSLVPNPNIRVSLVSFADEAKTETYFTNTMHKDEIFKAVERIQPAGEERANYAKATEHALRVLHEGGRADAKAAFVFFGDGNGSESGPAVIRATQRLHNTPALVVLAVDSSKETNTLALSRFTTGGKENVFNFDRNSQFIARIEQLARADQDCELHQRIFTASPFATDHGHLSRLFMDLANDLPNLDKVTPRPTTSTTEFFRTTRSLPTTESSDVDDLGLPSKFDIFSSTTPRTKPTTTIPFRPGCILDVMFIMDASGSVGQTFDKEKELAKNILRRFRIGPKNAKVSIVKFASENKVRVIHSFAANQTERDVFASFDSVAHSSGTTALHAALSTAAAEFAEHSRRDVATQVALIFSDGYGERELVREAEALREEAQYVYAVAIEHKHPINYKELVSITGEEERVFTDSNIEELEKLVVQHSRGCKEISEIETEPAEPLRLL
ncbi:hypothetical protein PMAYCL1PPCAC_24662, partial [Pristionchus mayeri]